MSILKVDELQSRTSGNRITLPDVNNYPPYRNLIINGDMSIAQRGTSSAGITSAGYYTCDRWKTDIITAGTWTQSQDTDVPTSQGFATSLKLDCTTADASLGASDRVFYSYRIESQNLQYLKKGTANAESVTASFWVKSNKTGTYILELFDTGNTRQISKSYTIDASNTWEKKTITFDGDTTGTLANDNGIGLMLQFWLSGGSNYTSGTLNTSWNSNTNANRAVGQVNLADSTSNYINITGVQLEVGDSATPFEHIPYDVNLHRCERYYETNEGGYQGPVYGTASDMRVTVQFRTKKRANPTLTKISDNENCCSGVTVVVGSIDETLGARVQGTNVFSAGAGKFFNAKFSADAEL